MNYKQYAALYWVARLGSFHAAARQLKTSQPAISSRIRELESDLGLVLFDRDRHCAKLTAKGHELFHYAAKLMQLAAEVRQRMEASDVVTGCVRFGIASIPAIAWLPDLVRDLSRTYPGIKPQFVVAPSADLAFQLREGRLDLAVLSGPLSLPSLRGQWLGKIGMVWLGSPDLDLPVAPLSAADLAVLPIISDTPGSQLHTLVTDWFRADSAEPSQHHACSSMSTRIQLAVEGLGIAIVPRSGAGRELAVGDVRVITTTRPLPNLEYLLVHGDFELTPATQIVGDLARQLLSDRLRHWR